MDNEKLLESIRKLDLLRASFEQMKKYEAEMEEMVKQPNFDAEAFERAWKEDSSIYTIYYNLIHDEYDKADIEQAMTQSNHEFVSSAFVTALYKIELSRIITNMTVGLIKEAEELYYTDHAEEELDDWYLDLMIETKDRLELAEGVFRHYQQPVKIFELLKAWTIEYERLI